MSSEKARENRLRRWAERLGYGLRKDRARTWGINHQGEYMIVDVGPNACIGGADFDYSLDDVEAFLSETEASLRASA